jgi:predicted nucleic-acid-binding protein
MEKEIRKIPDANILLRYILNDNPEQSEMAYKIIKQNDIVLLPEVMAEVIYVLSKMYSMSRIEVCNALNTVIKDTETDDLSLKLAVETYQNTSLDFVDCLLYAYNRLTNAKIFTFDKKLNKLLSQA